ncbi:hypothetical protein L1D14_03800 [Vibrio tubiashii]|uniref:hypothetical protein n=1 Tax=Vibrio tubiashii TaxID=29498 RepID=UPI001EFC3F73|nr:hypothetical protein [Vibrio tubiashii]MCG9575354.1 hypothetical protein [Vibrio tubiashii]
MHIVINLDETVTAPTIPKTLKEMIVELNHKWPSEATCVTQESDGAILFWSAAIEDVREARSKASLENGLVPLLGLGKQVDCVLYTVEDQCYVATDWQTAVVTLDQLE